MTVQKVSPGCVVQGVRSDCRFIRSGRKHVRVFFYGDPKHAFCVLLEKHRSFFFVLARFARARRYQRPCVNPVKLGWVGDLDQRAKFSFHELFVGLSTEVLGR